MYCIIKIPNSLMFSCEKIFQKRFDKTTSVLIEKVFDIFVNELYILGENVTNTLINTQSFLYISLGTLFKSNFIKISTLKSCVLTRNYT